MTCMRRQRFNSTHPEIPEGLHYLEKVEKEAKFLETKMMVIDSNDAEFGYPFKFLTTYYSQLDKTFGVFLEIFVCQKWHFFKF